MAQQSLQTPNMKLAAGIATTGGTGSDTATPGTGSNTATAGTGSDTATAGTGTATPGTGSDTATPGTGNDTASAGTGRDTATAGTGSGTQQFPQIPNTGIVEIPMNFDYGMKKNDPMCFHHFYNKLDDTPRTLTQHDVSYLVVISSQHNLYSLINWGYFVLKNFV